MHNARNVDVTCSWQGKPRRSPAFRDASAKILFHEQHDKMQITGFTQFLKFLLCFLCRSLWGCNIRHAEVQLGGDNVSVGQQGTGDSGEGWGTDGTTLPA